MTAQDKLLSLVYIQSFKDSPVSLKLKRKTNSKEELAKMIGKCNQFLVSCNKFLQESKGVAFKELVEQHVSVCLITFAHNFNQLAIVTFW